MLDRFLSGMVDNIYEGTIITNVNYDRELGMEAIRKDRADLVAYGRLFLANPDLPERFAADTALNKPNPDTFYGGGEHSYTDYPFMNEAVKADVA